MTSDESSTSQAPPAQRRGRLWVRKLTSFEEERRADAEFWRQMTPNERVEIVEQLRQEWWEQHGNGEPRLRRAVRVFAAP